MQRRKICSLLSVLVVVMFVSGFTSAQGKTMTPYQKIDNITKKSKITSKDLKEIQRNFAVILEWSKASHQKGNFNAAIKGYNKIINSKYSSKNQKQKAKALLYLAKQGKKLLGSKEVQQNVSPYTKAENIIKEGNFTAAKLKELQKCYEEILVWAKGSHLRKNYAAAADGYNEIINSEYANEAVKLKAQALLELAKNKLDLQPVYTNRYSQVSIEKRNVCLERKYTYQDNLTYSADGDYLNWGKIRANYYKSKEGQPTNYSIKLDNNGLPMVFYYTEYQYNPVTISQYALTMYGKYLYSKDEVNKNNLIKASDKLLEMMDADGALRENFEYGHYLHNYVPFRKGWVCGLGQGQAISALVRTYIVTGDKKYLEGAELAYKFLITPVSKGGTLDTLKELDGTDNIFFQEYVTNPKSYTLNGFMYTMLGVYDLSTIKESKYSPSAAEMFDKSNKTLERILYLYDMGHFTAYDAGFITRQNQPAVMNPAYHVVHIELTDALYFITKNPIYKYYNLMWKSYLKE